MPYLALISHILFIILLIFIIFKDSLGTGVADFIGKHAILLAFLVSLAAIAGSLFYSEVVGFEPCALCWWQRVAIYPQVVIFGIALWKKMDSAFLYAVPLALAATLVSLYHSYVYLGGTSILPCTALGGACSKIYVFAFGYITIPFMTLTIALYILLLAWANRSYAKDHTNA